MIDLFPSRANSAHFNFLNLFLRLGFIQFSQVWVNFDKLRKEGRKGDTAYNESGLWNNWLIIRLRVSLQRKWWFYSTIWERVGRSWIRFYFEIFFFVVMGSWSIQHARQFFEDRQVDRNTIEVLIPEKPLSKYNYDLKFSIMLKNNFILQLLLVLFTKYHFPF